MKNKIKEALKNKFLGEYTPSENKEKSIIILIVGFTIIFSLLIAIRINYNKPNNNSNNNNSNNSVPSVQFLSIDKIFNNYLDNYKYIITIDDNESIITYEGSVNDSISDGKRIINEEEINYHIANDIVIDLKTNKEINNLYNNYLSVFFNPNNVYEFIKDKEYTEEIVDNIKIYTYNSIYNDVDIMFKISTGKDRIEEIKYVFNNINYNIKFI